MNRYRTSLLVAMTSACASPSADRPDRPDRPADVAEDTSDASRDDETGAPGTPLPEGCGRPPPASGPATLDHEGLTRTYGLYVPPTYDPNIPTPIVFAFHGWGGQESEYLGHPTVIAEADARGTLVVVPRGLGADAPDHARTSWSFGGSTTGLDGDGFISNIPRDTEAICNDDQTQDYVYPSCLDTAANGCAWTHCQGDDVAFVGHLLDTLAEDLCIDADRIYATGNSNGGMFTWELAQDPRTAGRLRAIAPVIGLPHRGYLSGPGTDGELPTLVVTGAFDTTVPPGEWEEPWFTTSSDGDTYFYTGATAITRVFAEHHGCDTSEPATPVPGFEPECRSYCRGAPPAVVDCRLWMPHTASLAETWPMIMDFFDAWR